VWMSHKGTMPVQSNKTAFENCIDAVQKCHLFLGIITPYYGSGQDKENKEKISITHKELREAIRLNKPRWLLSHDHVVFARAFLKGLNYNTTEEREKLELNPHTKVLNDLRIIDMYEEAILSQHPLRDRKGNWVQGFQTDQDAFLFATAQFSLFKEVEEFINENLSDSKAAMLKAVKNGGKK
ncbi:MAG: DUF4062 domain-containing protein, partial [Candidatus Delongbacteria bacterium]|nr:DUF4062 domain-containing protein [Candidatus Delongbacteria bacterium]